MTNYYHEICGIIEIKYGIYVRNIFVILRYVPHNMWILQSKGQSQVELLTAFVSRN